MSSRLGAAREVGAEDEREGRPSVPGRGDDARRWSQGRPVDRQGPAAPTVTQCVFCDLVAGRGDASVVYEDDVVVALMDLYPVNPGHVLLVPRAHATNMADLDEETGAHVFRVALRMQQAVRRSGVRCEGINLFVADGEAAFQDVFHFHLHVIPRFAGDPFKIDADWHEAEREDLDRAAAAIGTAYRELWS